MLRVIKKMTHLQEIKTRLSWLSLGLLASLVIAHIITSFEVVLQKNLILASFIPLIVYMSDAVGTQMEAMIIRELNNKKKFQFSRFLKKQLTIVIPVAIIMSIAAGIVLFVWHSDAALAYTVGISLFFGIISSIFTGAMLPYFFWRIHKDPAEASGPIATVLQDMMSVLVFFYIAQLFF